MSEPTNKPPITTVGPIVDSIQRILKRWCVSQVPLIEDASAGTNTIKVKTTVRMGEGDELMLRDPSTEEGEIDLYIEEIVDGTTLLLSRNLNTDWVVSDHTSDNPIVEKLYHSQYVRGVYIGEPTGIPQFPAITVNLISRQSEWLTVDSTKETYNIEVAVYVLDTNQEDTVRFLWDMVDIIQYGLKQHIYPVVSPYSTTSLEEDITETDFSYNIKVADSSIFIPGTLHRMLIEDPWNTEEHVVTSILDSETIRVSTPICHTYYVDDGTQVISATRFFYNSWPADIQFGKVYKGTMLKAATVNWFAWEENINAAPPRRPSIV